MEEEEEKKGEGEEEDEREDVEIVGDVKEMLRVRERQTD